MNVTTSPGTPGATAGAVPNVLRRDIQGLSAVSVVAVVLDHAVGWPSGGFVGGDVFFVISGFLTTGLMLRAYERTGRISWIGFYRRRVRQIIPAATTTLVVTVIFSFLLFYESRFAGIGTDYFQQGYPPSPLLRFWSLAVKEQF